MAKRFIDGQEVTSSAFLPALGTVSESGGVPTGSIIESGSNANGNYIKYADGTMICSRFIDRLNIPTIGCTTSYSTLGLSGYISSSAINWTFPQEFSSVPVVHASAERPDRHVLVLAINNTVSTTSANGWRALVNSSLSAKFHPDMHFMAIGRWY